MSVHREWQSFVVDKSRDTSLRHSDVCAESGRVSLLTKAGTLHCATVLSVHKEGQSFIVDKSRDTSLRHSDVCAQRVADFHC